MTHEEYEQSQRQATAAKREANEAAYIEERSSLSELGRAAQKASRKRQERRALERRARRRHIFAIVAGAICGGLINSIATGATPEALVGCFVVTLFLASAGGLLGLAFFWRIAGLIIIAKRSRGDSLEHLAWPVALLAAETPAAWFAAGGDQATWRGYLIVIFWEVTTLLIERLIWPIEQDKQCDLERQ